MTVELPSKLYQYRRIDSDGHLLGLLTNAMVHFQTPLNFNDPFDSRWYGHYHGTDHDRRNWCRRQINERYPGFSQQQKDYEVDSYMAGFHAPEYDKHDQRDSEEQIRLALTKVGVSCLAEHPDNLLMWSHYANQHKGVCIEFSPQYFPSDYGPHKIRYSSEHPQINYLHLRKGDKSIGERVLLNKSLDWQYEAEWRLIAIDSAGKTIGFPLNSITGLIFGCQAVQCDIDRIIDAIKDRTPPISVSYAKKDPKSYKLDIIPDRR